MPQYGLAEAQEADNLEAESTVAINEATEDNQRADNYVLTIVLFVTALFFAGISTRLPTSRSRATILGVGSVVFAGAAAWIATFPVSVGL
jgi:hypothetical protein